MSFLNKLFRKTEVISSDKLQSRVIYNSQFNFIILISYGAKDFYSVIEFTSALTEIYQGNGGISIVISHAAIEEEPVEDENNFSKRPVTIINNRYYMLIGGAPFFYNKLFDVVPPSNAILRCIIQDIYHHRSSSDFKELINLGVLNSNNFKYQNVVPDNYDKLKKYTGDDSKVIAGGFDDFDKIMSRIPSSFSAIDVARLIYINAFTPHIPAPFFMRLPEFISDTLGEKNGSVSRCYSGITLRDFFARTYQAIEQPLLSHIIPNPDLTMLSILTVPLYMREELNEEDRINGDIPLDKMDEIFQQDYDRFNQPTAEYIEGYEDIDEIVSTYDSMEE